MKRFWQKATRRTNGSLLRETNTATSASAAADDDTIVVAEPKNVSRKERKAEEKAAREAKQQARRESHAAVRQAEEEAKTDRILAEMRDTRTADQKAEQATTYANVPALAPHTDLPIVGGFTDREIRRSEENAGRTSPQLP